MKMCTKCRIKKPDTEFPFLNSDKKLRRHVCRQCRNKQQLLSRHNLWKRHPEKHEQHKINVKKGHHARREENPEHVRMKRVTCMYKISEGRYWELRKIKYCQCCGSHESKFKKGLFIDHDHNTGRVRGLICCHCNFIAGFARDSKERLKLVEQYLS